MKPFASFDFETANEKRGSACSIGIAKFDSNGNCIDTYSSLILPHESLRYFNPVNTWTHGLTMNDVINAPEWADIVSEIEDFVGDLPLVAHNMAFDGYVIFDLSDLYGIATPANDRICTLRIARSILANELTSKKLPSVFEHYFPDDIFDHHEATSDAVAAGKIFCAMQQSKDFNFLFSIGVASQKRRPTSRRSGPASTAESSDSINSLIELYGDMPLLDGEVVSITGTLTRGKRTDIQELIAHLGGEPAKSLTKKTTILVVGIPDPQSWKPNSSGSSKFVKATKLRNEGVPIEVLSEETFFGRLEEIHMATAI